MLTERASLVPGGPPATGDQICRDLTALLDAALVELVAQAPPLEDGAIALVALGGYGRGELARHSDVDVMLVVEGHAEHALRLLYPLWDVGLKVGHSVRTIAQVTESARANVETFTSILDARFIAGDHRLFDAVLSDRRRLAGRLRGWLRSELATRRAQARDAAPWQTLAVDLKSGRGGLRDLHALHWLAAADAIADGTAEPPPPAPLLEARERLLRTRHAVHACADRPTDVFRPETADPVCAWLGVDPFQWAHALYAAQRTIDQAARNAFAAPPVSASRRWLPWRRHNPAPNTIPDTAAMPAVASDLEALVETLRSITPVALEPLGRPPWLERLLPEWEGLRARPHVAPFHIHPVDVHTIRTVVEARTVMAEDEFRAGTPEVARAFGRPDEVLIAAMLHDIGKPLAGARHPEAGAVIAERFATRAGLGPEEAARLVGAVRHHLLLPAVATRRDIADAQVIAETAETVGDLQLLRLLYVLAVADARASGPNVWNQWKAQLMRALFDRVSAVLDAAGPPSTTAREEAVVAALAARFPADVVRSHLRGLEAGYLISTPPSTIGDHIALIEEAAEGVAVRRERLGEIDRLTLVAPDRTGLLQDIAGTLAGFSVNVLGGVAYTRTDGVAIEVWHVSDALGVGIDDRRWERVLAALPAAARGEFDIEQRLAEARRYPQPPRRNDIPTTVNVENRASRDYSILEISAPDRRGVLYAVTRALRDMRIDIHIAKVDTIGPQIFDAFYIQRENGSRIEEPDEVQRLQRRIEEVLEAL